METVSLKTDKGSAAELITRLAAGWIQAAQIHGALLPAEDPWGNLFPTVFTNAEMLSVDARPLAPAMPVNVAALCEVLSRGTWRHSKPLLVLARPCEARAVIELVKLKQVKRERLVILVVDCPGTLPAAERRQVRPGAWIDQQRATEQALASGEDLSGARDVCRACAPEIAAPTADLSVGLWGLAGEEVTLTAHSESGQRLLDKIDGDLSQGDAAALQGRRDKTLSAVAERRQATRRVADEKLLETANSLAGLAELLGACAGCHACMRACPICFCHQCFFESDQTRVSPPDWLRRANQRGAVRLPADRVLFHLGRMTHMALSCINCGLCEDACRAGIPLAGLFRLAGDAMDAVVGYQPGADPAAPLPTTVFHYDELHEVERDYSSYQGGGS